MRCWMAFAVVMVFSGLAHAGEYSAWTVSPEYPKLSYRVKYRNYNTARVKEQKSPHDWCYETRNDYAAGVKLKAAITDAAAEAAPKDKWSSVTLEPGKTHESCINFLDTAEGGSVRVWFDKVVVDGKPVAPPCDPGAVSPDATVSKQGELLELAIIQAEQRMSLPRKKLLELRSKKKPAPGELLLYLGGSGAPVMTLKALAPLYCPVGAASAVTDRTLGVMRDTLERVMREGAEEACAKDKKPDACVKKILKKTHTSEGVRG